MPIMIVCGACHSPNVTRDALAAWDYEAQTWTLQPVLDQGNCDDCGSETQLTEFALPLG